MVVIAQANHTGKSHESFPVTHPDIALVLVIAVADQGGAAAELLHKIRAGFLLHGVDAIGWPGGLVSAAHTDEDVTRTLEAFDRTLDLLAAEGDL